MVFRFACLVLTLLAGCASVTGPTGYPPEWARLDTSATPDGCPSLSGTYSNRGTGSFPKELGEPPSLSDVFARMGRGSGQFAPRETGHVWPEAEKADSVLFKQDPESLAVTFIQSEKPAVTLNFRRYHFDWFEKRYDDIFHCHNAESGARLRFLAEQDGPIFVRGFPYVFGEWKGAMVFLLKADDGSLVVQYRTETVFIPSVLVGTHVRFDSIWWRYPLITTSH